MRLTGADALCIYKLSTQKDNKKEQMNISGIRRDSDFYKIYKIELEKYMNYERVTIQDCLDLFSMKGKRTILNDGEVKGFEE